MKKIKKSNKTSAFIKFVIVFFIILFLGAGGMVYELYSRVYQPNIVFDKGAEDKYVYIPTNSDFTEVSSILLENGLLINANSFDWLAKQKQYHKNIKAGRYKIDRSLNNNELINLLRSGKQTPIKVTFNNLRTKEQLAGKIAAQIEADSLSIINFITDSVLHKRLDLNNYNITSVFIPNTYEFYWNTSAKGFVNRMLEEHDKFWTPDRRKKAKRIQLNYHEVSSLASIVEKEQNIKLDERPKIAGLYLI